MNIFSKYLQDKMNDFHSGVSATVRAVAHTRKVLGSIPGMDKGILKFWGAYRPAFSENEFQTKFFFEKLSFFFEKLSFWIWTDMHRYAHICTNMHRYAQICTDIRIYERIQDWYTQISTDTHDMKWYVMFCTYNHLPWQDYVFFIPPPQFYRTSAGMDAWYCCSLSMFVLIQAAWKSANAQWWRLCGTIARGRHVPGGQAPPRLEQKCSISQAQTQWCTWSLSPISWGGCLLCPLEILARFPTPWGTGRLLAMSMASVTGMANLDQAAASFTSTRGPWSGRQTMASLLGDRANVNGPWPFVIQ